MIQAAAAIGLRDPDWLRDERYGGMVREMVREFTRNEISPIANELDRKEKFIVGVNEFVEKDEKIAEFKICHGVMLLLYTLEENCVPMSLINVHTGIPLMKIQFA